LKSLETLIDIGGNKERECTYRTLANGVMQGKFGKTTIMNIKVCSKLLRQGERNRRRNCKDFVVYNETIQR